jgi:glycine cleavage system aminomethyltransferase T
MEQQNNQKQEVEKFFPLAVYAPFDQKVDFYVNKALGIGAGSAVPYEYTNWREEVMSWKENCYIHAGLNPAPTFRVKGPGTLKFFSDISVNSFAKFQTGSLRHCIMCNEEGLVSAHGVLLRLDEDEFLSYFLAPYALFKFSTGNYNAKGEMINDQFIFQIAGPRSLETLETATGECLHDIKFARYRRSVIGGMGVRISRMGMAGTLAYEVHGNINDTRQIYNIILAAGESFGIKKLGHHAYQLSHTEDGFPQCFMHFPLAWGEDIQKFLGMTGSSSRLVGSMGTNIRLRFRNPIELGWGKMIKFDHDFIGRKVLEKEIANPRRAMVTLEWNPDDILDICASMFQPGEHYAPMGTSHLAQQGGAGILYADQVLKNGKLVGVSSGRNYSYYYRKMISLCSIDIEYSTMGTEVSVLWGNPGTRQKEIRAVVSRFPYLNENRNEGVDVSTIDRKSVV